jgi:hypothetical protein
MRAVVSVVILLLVLSGCAGHEIKRKDGSSSARAFSISQVAKSEVNMVAEINQQQVLAGLKVLTEKLYRRNPREFRKSGLDSAEAATAKLFDELPGWSYSATTTPAIGSMPSWARSRPW